MNFEFHALHTLIRYLKWGISTNIDASSVILAGSVHSSNGENWNVLYVESFKIQQCLWNKLHTFSYQDVLYANGGGNFPSKIEKKFVEHIKRMNIDTIVYSYGGKKCRRTSLWLLYKNSM